MMHQIVRRNGHIDIRETPVDLQVAIGKALRWATYDCNDPMARQRPHYGPTTYEVDGQLVAKVIRKGGILVVNKLI